MESWRIIENDLLENNFQVTLKLPGKVVQVSVTYLDHCTDSQKAPNILSSHPNRGVGKAETHSSMNRQIKNGLPL